MSKVVKFKLDDKVVITEGPHKGKHGLIDGTAPGKYLVWIPTTLVSSLRTWCTPDKLSKEK